MNSPDQKHVQLNADRQEANRQLGIILFDLIEKHPSLRFHQLLQGYGFTEKGADEFYVEPMSTLQRVTETLARYEAENAKKYKN